MPITEKQLAANRTNARKSRGLVTPAGKRASALSARAARFCRAARSRAVLGSHLRHGVLGHSVVLGGECAERFAACLNALIAEFDPQTHTERTQVEKMAICHWRLARLWAVEAASIEHEIALQSGPDLEKDAPTRAWLAIRALSDSAGHSDSMSRKERRVDQHYHQAVNTLAALLRTRKSREIQKMHGDPIQPHQNKQVDHPTDPIL